MVADQVLRDSFGGRFDHVSRDRVGCVLGVCSGLELVGEMAGRLQRPAFVKTLREHGLPEDEVQAITDAIVSLAPEWNESTFPGLLEQRRHGANRRTTSTSAARTSRPTRRARAPSPPWRWRLTCSARATPTS